MFNFKKNKNKAEDKDVLAAPAEYKMLRDVLKDNGYTDNQIDEIVVLSIRLAKGEVTEQYIEERLQQMIVGAREWH